MFFLGCTTNKSSEPSPTEHSKNQLPDFSSIKTENVFYYKCDNSYRFTAHVTTDSTWLFLADTTVKVNPVLAGSGARYEANPYLFWSKSNEALLQLPTGGLMNCTSIPRESSWQAARIRGVDFRALGQEPGWILEITDGKLLKYIGNYGEDTLTVANPEPVKNNSDKVRRYDLETESGTLQIEIDDTPCRDAMSGFKFPETVTVTLGEEVYTGCGRYLDSLLSN